MNSLEKLIKKCDDIISKKGYLEIGYIHEVGREAKKLSDNEDEVHQLVLNCEEYLQENYNCIDDDLSGYVYSKELSFNDIEEFYNHFNILEEQLNKRYKI